MTLGRKHWELAPTAPPVLFDRFRDLHPLVVQVLYNRGLTDLAEVTAFLAGEVISDNPFQLRGVEQAVTLIRRRIQEGASIAVYGDYDVDGVTATAILVQTLTALGAQVTPYIPDRLEEGYGLNVEALTQLAQQGTRLLITVDCGIRSLEEVAHARAQGMSVIVTDHHHVGAALPQAEAVINPRQPGCPYPSKDLAGAGVAFKLAQALLRANHKVPLPTTAAELSEEALLDLVALGTIADMVPLLGENHVLTRRGMARLNRGQRPGLAALIDVSGLEPGQITATTVSFQLSPRLNAAGRISDAVTALQLLLAPDLGAALPLAQELDRLNRERQDLTQVVHEHAQALIAAQEEEPLLLFAASSEFPVGILGLAAGRLLDRFYRPVVVVEQGEVFSKGSARSIPEFHITEALDSVAPLLERYGGHAAAAGFTIRTERLPQLRARLQTLAEAQLRELNLRPQLFADAELPLEQLSWDVLAALEMLAPFGYGNPRPVLVSRRVRVLHARTVGAEGRHLKLFLGDQGGHSWDAIAFRQGDWMGRLPQYIDVAYVLERNEWNGNVRLQLNVKDIHASGGE